MSSRWKALERAAAEALGGRRITEPWQLFRERPDVVADLPDGRRLVIECKAYTRHAHHRHLEKCQSVYCEPGDIPTLITREPGGRAYATVPLTFLKSLLETGQPAQGDKSP